jgi:hypothetical protein
MGHVSVVGISRQVLKHGAEFYIVLGKFGEGTTAADKFAVALHFFVEPDRCGFAVVDAEKTSISSHPIIRRALSRADVIDTPLAQEVFDLVDAIWFEDENIAEVRDSSGGSRLRLAWRSRSRSVAEVQSNEVDRTAYGTSGLGLDARIPLRHVNTLDQ